VGEYSARLGPLATQLAILRTLQPPEIAKLPANA